MAGDRASSDDWEDYYQRADRVRAEAGDPFRRYAKRVAARERAWLIGGTVVLLATIGAFFLLTLQQ
jgi:hypothetical protein